MVSSLTSTLLELLNLMKERASFIQEMLEGDYFFNTPAEYDAKTVRKKWKEATPERMQLLLEVDKGVEDWKADKYRS